MESVWIPTLLAVAAVSMVSLIGAAAGARFLTRHLVILTLVALAAGSLLGDALLHLLPEAAELWDGFTVPLAALVIAGFLAFFVMESVLRWKHAHGEVLEADAHSHDEAAHGHHAKLATPAARVAPFAWMNLIGDGVHNFLDGVVIAAAFLVDVPLGIATTVAVALHEIPQELGDFAVLLRAGVPPRRALLYNFLSAVTAFLGAALFLILPLDQTSLERIALPVTAGGFLYIAAADLIPELHHHTGDRHVVLILAGLLGGIGIMFALLQIG